MSVWLVRLPDERLKLAPTKLKVSAGRPNEGQ